MKTKPEFQPTDENRKTVEAMCGYGIPQEDIAKVIGIAPATLRKHFRHELDVGSAKANAKVAESLFKKATGDKGSAVTAAIWWTKTRMGWRETIVNEHGVTDDLANLMREVDGQTRTSIPLVNYHKSNGSGKTTH